MFFLNRSVRGSVRGIQKIRISSCEAYNISGFTINSDGEAEHVTVSCGNYLTRRKRLHQRKSESHVNNYGILVTRSVC